MANKICVYTCITGEYDDLKEIKNVEKNIDYYCFTNNKKIKSKTWNVVYIEDNELSNLLLARKTKILGNPIINENYDIELWMDAAVEFVKPINEFIDHYLGKNDKFVCFKHGIRNSIEEEMNACLRFRKESIENIENLKEFYKKEKYNYDNGLVESTVLIKRPKDKKVIETMKIWYDIVSNYSRRDQLSFNYAIYKTGLKVKWIYEYVFNNDWFSWYDHRKEQFPKNYMMYFGDISDYDYKYQISGEYKIKDNKYIIEEIVKNDTNEIYVELSNVPIVKYKLEELKNIKVNYENTIVYRGNNIFFKSPGFIILKGNFNKDDKLKLVVTFEKVEDYEKNNILDYYVSKYFNDTIDRDNQIANLEFELSDIKGAYRQLKESYDQTLNSTSWKITSPIRKLSSKIKK